jgi:pseudouridine synthase
MRLQRYLAACGDISRRKAEELIISGMVTVNGVAVKELGKKVDLTKDRVKLDGRLVRPVQKGALILFKPRGVLTTLSKQERRPTVRQYLSKKTESYFPVGRLDYDTSGLLIMTNDGDFAQILTHPRYQHSRVYYARVRGLVDDSLIQKCAKGVRLSDGIVTAKVRFLSSMISLRKLNASYSLDKQDKLPSTWIEVTITEGRNRIVRRLCAALNHPVLDLARIAHGPFSIGSLKPGELRHLTFKEFSKFKNELINSG